MRCWGMRSVLLGLCVGLVACGSVKNENLDAPPPPPGDGNPMDMPGDMPGDGAPKPMPRFWLKMDDPPTDGALDSAGSHVTSCLSATQCPAQIAPGKVNDA